MSLPPNPHMHPGHMHMHADYGCCQEDIFCDTDGARRPVYQKYVGQGKGAYQKVDDYIHVGQGRGDYNWERQSYPWWRWCLWIAGMIFLISLLFVAVRYLWGHWYHDPIIPRYDCFTSAGSLPPPGAKIIETWSLPRQIWCCDNMGVACATTTHLSTTHMPTTWIMVPVPDFHEAAGAAAGMPAAAGANPWMQWAKPWTDAMKKTMTFHCHVGIPTMWLQEQRDYCCEHTKIGCEQPPAEVPEEPDCAISSSNNPADWAPSKRSWCCAKKQLGCEGDSGAGFSCTGDATTWQQEQKTWCCVTAGMGCTTAPPAANELYDCTAGFANWQDAWPEEQQQWCCTNHGRACNTFEKAMAIDCDSAMANLAEDTKQWCCEHHGKLCEA